MKVFKEQINELVTFWECELEDVKQENLNKLNDNVMECEMIIKNLKELLKLEY